ncbi:MAG: phage tail assembly protein T [Planctomycetota bacterium]|jgi:hypothetical protein
MLAEIPARKLLEWEVLYAIQPWGEKRADIRHGILCSLLDACHRTKGSPEPPRYYMPFCEKRAEPHQTIEQQKAIFAVAKAALERQSRPKPDA